MTLITDLTAVRTALHRFPVNIENHTGNRESVWHMLLYYAVGKVTSKENYEGMDSEKPCFNVLRNQPHTQGLMIFAPALGAEIIRP